MIEHDNPKVCVLCGAEFYGWGNNPAPVVDEGRACNPCNADVVVPARLAVLLEGSRSMRVI